MNRSLLWITAVGFGLASAPVRAQDGEGLEEGSVEAVEPASPEVVEAWAPPGPGAGRSADDLARESESFARIHEADESLLEFEAAQRMVGFDLMDGVR